MTKTALMKEFRNSGLSFKVFAAIAEKTDFSAVESIRAGKARAKLPKQRQRINRKRPAGQGKRKRK